MDQSLHHSSMIINLFIMQSCLIFSTALFWSFTISLSFHFRIFCLPLNLRTNFTFSANYLQFHVQFGHLSSLQIAFCSIPVSTNKKYIVERNPASAVFKNLRCLIAKNKFGLVEQIQSDRKRKGGRRPPDIPIWSSLIRNGTNSYRQNSFFANKVCWG